MILKMLRPAKMIESISIFMYHLVSSLRVKGALASEKPRHFPRNSPRALSVVTSRVKDCPQMGRSYIAMTACDV